MPSICQPVHSKARRHGIILKTTPSSQLAAPADPHRHRRLPVRSAAERIQPVEDVPALLQLTKDDVLAGHLGELALVAFSVHSSGVDQVLIRKEWYNGAFASAPARFPSYYGPPLESRQPRQQPLPMGNQFNQPPVNPSPIMPRAKTPPSEEVDVEASGQEGGRGGKGKNNKGKNVGWKDKEEREKVEKKAEVDYSSDLGATLSKEIKKSEESLHTRLGRLISKELDKQRTYSVFVSVCFCSLYGLRRSTP